MPPSTQPSLFDRLAGLFARQEVRYLIAGGWNTLFGYVVYAVPYFFFHGRIHYMVIAVVANPVAITMAYATHKLFVFRTKGNVLREYLKFYGVYGVITILGLLALPFCVEVLRMSPYVAPLLIIGVSVVVSYFGHKYFSFRQPSGDA